MSKIASRLQKLRQKFAEKEIDAILISQPENRLYLSGFDGSAGYLLITLEKAILATDFRYTEQAQRQAPDYKILQTKGEIIEWFPGLLAGLNIKRLGFEGEHITFTSHQRISEALLKAQSPISLVPLNGLVESLRAIKEPEEIKLITKAVEITDRAFAYIARVIHVGMSEKDLAWEVEKFLRENGSQSPPFELIVASGPNAALPHARPSERTIGSGEPVIIDIGARFDGYASDVTRTFYLGKPDDKFNRVYPTVLNAQLTAIDKGKSGMTGVEIDNRARKVIEQAGYGETFGHGLGHGIGLATHEPPRLGPKSLDQIVDGMVFTVEPGIYISGWSGVRIEDVVIMENGKIRVISSARK